MTGIGGLPRVLAHQSGWNWDEFLLVSIPVFLLVLLLVRANRAATQFADRARREADTKTPPSPQEGSITDPAE